MSPPASPISESSEPSIKAFQDVLWDTGSVEEFAETFATNVTAVYYTTIAFLDLLHEGNLRRQRLAMANPIDSNHHLRPPYHTSQVLSVSSSGSFRLDSRVLSPSYTLSKGACTQLGKLLANLLSPWGIRSNVLAPGVWPTGMVTIFAVVAASFIDMIYPHPLPEHTDMTIRPTPGFALDPFALADAVPLRRAGTQEVSEQIYLIFFPVFICRSRLLIPMVSFSGYGWDYPVSRQSRGRLREWSSVACRWRTSGDGGQQLLNTATPRG